MQSHKDHRDLNRVSPYTDTVEVQKAVRMHPEAVYARKSPSWLSRIFHRSTKRG